MRILISVVVFISADALITSLAAQQQLPDNRHTLVNGKRQADTRVVSLAKTALATHIGSKPGDALLFDWFDTAADIEDRQRVSAGKRWFVGGEVKAFADQRYFWGAIMVPSDGSFKAEYVWAEPIVEAGQKPKQSRFDGPPPPPPVDEQLAAAVGKEAEREVMRALGFITADRAEWSDVKFSGLKEGSRECYLSGNVIDPDGERWYWQVKLTRPMELWRADREWTRLTKRQKQ